LMRDRIPSRGFAADSYESPWSAAAQQTVSNLVRSGRKQR